jgi:hypothetical protein
MDADLYLEIKQEVAAKTQKQAPKKKPGFLEGLWIWIGDLCNFKYPASKRQ